MPACILGMDTVLAILVWSFGGVGEGGNRWILSEKEGRSVWPICIVSFTFSSWFYVFWLEAVEAVAGVKVLLLLARASSTHTHILATF